ncbi:MAG: hypothetical protein AABZ11_09730 [Nitrospinota bacterium]
MAESLRLDKGQIEVVDDVVADVLRHKTSAERIGIGFALWTSAYKMLKIHLKTAYPDWDAKKIEQEVIKRLSHGTL